MQLTKSFLKVMLLSCLACVTLRTLACVLVLYRLILMSIPLNFPFVNFTSFSPPFLFYFPWDKLQTFFILGAIYEKIQDVIKRILNKEEEGNGMWNRI